MSGAQATADEVLTRAKSQSENTVATARVEAEGRVQRAEEEITTLREHAEERMHSLQADISAVVEQRRVLLAEVRTIAARLAETAGEEEPADAEGPPAPASAEVS